MLSKNVVGTVLRTSGLKYQLSGERRMKSAVCVGKVKQPHLGVMIIVHYFQRAVGSVAVLPS